MEPGSVQNGMDYDLNMEPLVKNRTGNQTMISVNGKYQILSGFKRSLVNYS